MDRTNRAPCDDAVDRYPLTPDPVAERVADPLPRAGLRHRGLPAAAQSSSQDIAYSEAAGLGKWIPGGDVWIPATHGWLYLAYVVASIDLWMRSRLPAGRMALVVLAGTVPVMSFVAERWVTGRLRPMIAAVVENRES
jgi:integral membrane protein